MNIRKVPAYRDLTCLYLDGMTKENIILIYKVDASQKDLKGMKHATKKKIDNFFKVIEESKRIYIVNPKARSDRAYLMHYISKKTNTRIISIVRIFEVLEKQGWNIQETTKNMEFLDRLS